MEQKLLSVILNIAREMTAAGGEVHRSEESLQRMCRAYGWDNPEVYVTTTHILLSVSIGGNIVSRHLRIERVGTDIDKLDRLNGLVRWISETAPDLEEIENRLSEIKEKKGPSFLLLVFCYASIAALFCVFFGSRSISEIIVAFIAGIVLGTVGNLMDSLKTNKILSSFASSLATGFVVAFFMRQGFITNPNYIIIGNIMPIIPGIGITNAFKDMFVGDVVTGVYRLIEALLITIGIALGYAVPSLLMGGVF